MEARQGGVRECTTNLWKLRRRVGEVGAAEGGIQDGSTAEAWMCESAKWGTEEAANGDHAVGVHGYIPLESDVRQGQRFRG